MIYFLFITIHDIPFSLISKSVSPQTNSTGLSCCIPWGHPHIIASFVAVYDSLHFIKSILSVPVGATQHITWPVPTRFPSTLKSNHYICGIFKTPYCFKICTDYWHFRFYDTALYIRFETIYLSNLFRIMLPNYLAYFFIQFICMYWSLFRLAKKHCSSVKSVPERNFEYQYLIQDVKTRKIS